MRVALLHPGWDRPCSVCEAYRPRDDGSFALDKRTALPLARVPGTPTPCHKCPKVPAAARNAGLDWRELRKLAQDMTDANRDALAFYRRCRATDRFPDDPLVAWYAGIIQGVEDAAAREEQRAGTNAVVAAVLAAQR